MATRLAFLIRNRLEDFEVHCGTRLERFAKRTIETGIVELRGHSSPSPIAASSSAQYASAPMQAATTRSGRFGLGSFYLLEQGSALEHDIEIVGY